MSVATSFALDLESEGMCARGISGPETAHVSIGHGGEEKVTPSPSPLFTPWSFYHGAAKLVSGRCLHRGLFTTVQRSHSSVVEEKVICDPGSDWGELWSHAHVNSVSVVSHSVCRQVSRCVSVIHLYLFHLSLLCVLLGIGALYHAGLELEIVDFASEGQDVSLVMGQFVLTGGPDVQVSVEALFGEFSGRTVAPTASRDELSVAAKGRAELQLSEGDLDSRDRLAGDAKASAGGIDVVGAGPAANTGRESRSKSTTAATKSRKRAWQAFFVSLSVRDPPYTKREQNQFFKKLEAAFLSNDRDGDAFISFSELQRAVTRLVPGRGGDLFREADLNRDGVLGFDE